MKKPWYVWFSFFGFVGLVVLHAVKILILERPFNFSRWVHFCGKFAILFFGGFLVPVMFALLIYTAIANTNALIGEIFLFVVWLFAYVCGVIITNKLYQWSMRNTY